MTTPEPQVFSNWQSNKRYRVARRKQGNLTLVEHEGKYALIDTGIVFLSSDSLSEAIDAADRIRPPAGWSFVASMWLSAHWIIKAHSDGWCVYNREGDRMSTQVFSRSDQARKWCEVRADRVGMNLKGPKPSSKFEAEE